MANSPTNATDPSGLDFIAVAHRRVDIPGNYWAYHYSLQYIKTDCNALFGDRFEYSYVGSERPINIFGNPNFGKKTAAVELLRHKGYKAYGTIRNGAGAEFAPVEVAIIQYFDTSNEAAKIFEADDPLVVKWKWGQVIAAAKNYKFAEQLASPQTFPNWPYSRYHLFGTNSNTFVHYIAATAGIGFADGILPGMHPGAETPSRNMDEGLEFHAKYPPFKEG